MTTLKTNRLNTCCYDHLNEEQVEEVQSNPQVIMSDYMSTSILRITGLIEKWKYLIVDLTTTAVLAIFTFLLNLFV